MADKNTGEMREISDLQFDQTDSDGDGLSDFVEKIIGTDPHEFDSDGDGQGDGFERQQGTDPNDVSDFTPINTGDGNVVQDNFNDDAGDSSVLGDGDVAFGTGNVNTGSGEVIDTGDVDLDVASTGPLDTDGDGLSDEYELRHGLDPESADSDKDGLDDQYEIQLGTDPLDLDTDGDGVSDYAEVKLGTDPLDAKDTPDHDALAELFE